MGKRRFLVLSVGLLLLLVAGIRAAMVPIGADKYEITVEVDKGWNLVLLFDVNEILPDSEITESDIAAVYVFDPFEKRYLQFYPNNEVERLPENTELKKEENSPFYINSAVWLYSRKKGTLKFRRFDVIDLEDMKLKGGWNFLGLTDHFYRKSINDIKGDCEVEKFYGWNSATQSWEGPFEEQYSDYVLADTEGDLGKGLLIKVREDCNLGLQQPQQPPELPE